jgi:hypothetical protein
MLKRPDNVVASAESFVEQRAPDNPETLKQTVGPTPNIFERDIGVAKFYELVHEIICNFLPLYHCDKIFLRGDTAAVLAELVQSGMIMQFEQGYKLAIEFASSEMGNYPTLTCRHLEIQGDFGSRICYPSGIWEGFWSPKAVFSDFAKNVLDATSRNKVVRSLSLRAGVVKMKDEVYEMAWWQIVLYILNILEPVLKRAILAPIRGPEKDENRVLIRRETPWTTPPLSERFFLGFMHTLVPRQLETAAESLGLPSKVYGDPWFSLAQNTENAEREKMWDRYAYEDDEEGSVLSAMSDCGDSYASDRSSHFSLQSDRELSVDNGRW